MGGVGGGCHRGQVAFTELQERRRAVSVVACRCWVLPAGWLYMESQTSSLLWVKAIPGVQGGTSGHMGGGADCTMDDTHKKLN